MVGVKRVAVFCLLTAILPSILIIIPLYLRHSKYADVNFVVTESDIMEVRDGISTVFCEKHSLKMNKSFNAFQLSHKPEVSAIRKHIRINKSMTLPDDTLEYWGFFLLKGATVNLKICSRFEGARILIVKGEKNLRTCGLLEHTISYKAKFAKNAEQVKVTFETANEIKTKPKKEIVSITSSEKKKQINSILKSTTSDDKESEMNHAGEDLSTDDEEVNKLKQIAHEYLEKLNDEKKTQKGNNTIRHQKHHKKNREENKNEATHERIKRDTIYDRKVNHGGNALNFTDLSSGSVSSFENSLLTCYDGDILLSRSFGPSSLCESVQFLEDSTNNVTHLTVSYQTVEDGYYYYIFYSDNDLIKNDIYAVFDMFKPTYQYANVTDNKKCFNSTECSFPISFWSQEVIVVEVPTQDGIELEIDDSSILISTCHPRMAIYIIFPVSVLFLILCCAFL